MYRLIVNKIRCKFCGDVIESKTRNDFQQCKCGKCATDGGLEYARRAYSTEKPEDCFEDLSIYQNTDTMELIYGSGIKPEDIPTGGEETKPASPEPDIPEVTEAGEAEPEKITERDENGKPVAGRYPYGGKKEKKTVSDPVIEEYVSQFDK